MDYDDRDDQEVTMEVSLFAEAFNEMLMQHFGMRIHRALSEEWYVTFPKSCNPALTISCIAHL